ncbi:MAG TPA: signal peptide peptidase SppA [Sedimentisphaerales bacterium]|nr:signal peptide peptidase SppA [Sedimentisphaerales bacterium]
MFRKMNWCTAGLCLSACLVTGCSPQSYLLGSMSWGRKLAETEIQRDKGFFVTDKIAVIDVDGVMANRRRSGLLREGENPVSMFVEKLEKARRDGNVRAVVLRLNSPGGTIGAADLMYHHLREFRAKSRKPVVACMLDVAASGAYYLACGCDGIVAQPTTVTGSIGTIVQTMSFAGTMEKLGIKSVAIKSGKLKDMASPLHDLSEEEREVLQGIVTQYYDQFVNVVDEGRRGLDENGVRALADGRVFTAKEALDAGLIDRVGYPTDAVSWAKKLAGVTKARVVMYHRPSGYAPNIYASTAAGAEGLVPLVNVELPDWLTSEGTQFLYLWQPGLGGN